MMTFVFWWIVVDEHANVRIHAQSHQNSTTCSVSSVFERPQSRINVGP